MASGPDQPDFLDLLPDPLLLLILNRVSDIKTLLRCRSVSRRLSALVPHSDSLLLRVDRVIPPPSHDAASLLSSFLRTLVATLHHLISPDAALPNSPSRILRGFEAIKALRIELPAGDLRPDKGTSIRWVARFGRTLQSCVILAFGGGGGGGLKMRVVWTISALIAASARHHMAAEVVVEQRLLSHLTVCDRENEGEMIMDKDGLREFRERTDAGAADETNGGGAWWRNSRTTVPAVKMRMRHEPRLELSSGVVMEGATLVVVKPIGDGGGERQCEAEETYGDEALAAEAFGNGVNAEAVEKLLKSRTYVLEMNSF